MCIVTHNNVFKIFAVVFQSGDDLLLTDPGVHLVHLPIVDVKLTRLLKMVHALTC